MLSMTQRNSIRKQYYEQGKNISEISKESGYDRKTVRKCITQTDFNFEVNRMSNAGRPPKLAPFHEVIDSWLIEDKQARRKQRHTAKRIYDRLRREWPDDFFCCYKTVANYVSRRRKEIYANYNCSLPLEHIAGEAQVDFGQADFYENGRKYEGKYLNLSFPHSNQGYMQLFKGESQECLFEGLISIFHYIGGVPPRIWFDNASTMVKEILKEGGRELTDGFLRFVNHHNFEVAFCNAGAGNEKGSVEAKVGYHRRNILVPVPRFPALQAYNIDLLSICQADGDREHYKKEELIRTLHQEDLKKLFPLPEKEFDTASYLSVRINAYGKFTLNKGLHEYSAIPRLAGKRTSVRITAHSVIVLDENFNAVVIHDRLYGSSKQSSMQWIPYLAQLAKKPAALKYSGIYPMMPSPMQDYLSQCKKSDQGKVLQALERITRESGFDKAVETVNEALSYGTTDPESLLTLHTYRNAVNIDLEPATVPKDIPLLDKVVPDVKSYDAFLQKVGDALC